MPAEAVGGRRHEPESFFREASGLVAEATGERRHEPEEAPATVPAFRKSSPFMSVFDVLLRDAIAGDYPLPVRDGGRPPIQGSLLRDSIPRG